MIKVTYYRDDNRVIMEGHAGSAPIGQDLVCASASILIQTLALFVCNMAEARQTKCPIVKLSEGHAFIDCKAPTRYKSVVTLAFDTICAGFGLLAHDYPDNISYEIRDIKQSI
ncbi:MAG: ribosomal-processing cysteine protease Prp [Clostridia bacterium]|nr:ribosomal-processing cysteine protease Prp [Clostridia bacterium]